MSRLYGEEHRKLQDQFQSRPLADRIEQIALKTEMGDQERGFIESRDFFFLATVNEQGQPTVSYKGGYPGFVKVLDANTLLFPSYDGNGMYLSMGNIDANSQIGFLFIDFEKPFRMRAQGTAELSSDPELLALFKEAELVVKVAVSEIWMNCPRYIHRFERVKSSRYVPQDGAETPLCEWKRVDAVQDVLRPAEVEKVQRSGGVIPTEDWIARVQAGDETA